MTLATALHQLAEQVESAIASLDVTTLSAEETTQLQPMVDNIQRHLATYVSYVDARTQSSNIHVLPIAHETANASLDAELAYYNAAEFSEPASYALPMVVGDHFTGTTNASSDDSTVHFEWNGSQCIVTR